MPASRSVVSVLLRSCENLLSWHASGRTLDGLLRQRRTPYNCATITALLQTAAGRPVAIQP